MGCRCLPLPDPPMIIEKCEDRWCCNFFSLSRMLFLVVLNQFGCYSSKSSQEYKFLVKLRVMSVLMQLISVFKIFEWLPSTMITLHHFYPSKIPWVLIMKTSVHQSVSVHTQFSLLAVSQQRLLVFVWYPVFNLQSIL